MVAHAVNRAVRQESSLASRQFRHVAGWRLLVVGWHRVGQCS